MTTVRRLWGNCSRSLLFPALMLTLMPGDAHSQPPASPPPAPPAAPVVALPADFDARMERVLRTFEVPGMAVAIVKDGVPVLTKGYGVRRLGDSVPVDENTLLCIASNSKAFTGAALGMLVEEGKLEWDAPVIRYLPWFQMNDPWVTREITVRDLLVHRSGLGLGAGDLMIWPPSDHSRREVVRRLRYVPTVTSFRSRYAYDNVLYLVAGEVVEAVSGQSWEEFVATRILKRLGMDSSLSSLVAAEHAPALATPHAVIEGKLKPVAYFAVDSINPAGGITSSAADMSRWLRTLLAGGKIPGSGEERLFSEKTGRELMTPVTPMPIDDPAPELAGLRMNFCSYALGFSVRDYRGCRLVTHTGGLPGYASRVMLIPEHGLGIAVLTNQESGEAFNAVIWQIVDHFLGAPEVDWTEAFLRVRDREQRKIADAEAKTAATRGASTAGGEGSPSLPLPGYAGIYTDAWYGDISLIEENGRLVMRFTHTPSMIGDLEHWAHDTFAVRWRDRDLRADAFVTFALNPDGSIDQAKMRAISPAVDFSFDFHDLLLKPTAAARKSKP